MLLDNASLERQISFGFSDVVKCEERCKKNHTQRHLHRHRHSNKITGFCSKFPPSVFPSIKVLAIVDFGPGHLKTP